MKPGDRFGKLTFTGNRKKFGRDLVLAWKCDCGAVIYRKAYRVVSAPSPSCRNCYAVRGLAEVGRKYGSLRVTDQSRVKGTHRLYRCECDCGGEAWMRLDRLRVSPDKRCADCRTTKKPKPSGPFIEVCDWLTRPLIGGAP